MSALRAWWDEPAVENPPAVFWRDWWLVGTLAALAIVEGLFRPDLVWRPLAAPLQLIPIVMLLWRRTRPLMAVATAWAVVLLLDVAAIVSGRDSPGLWTMIGLVFFPYALWRWGSGREAIAGLAIMAVPHVTNMVFFPGASADTAAGFAFLLFPSALGAAVRFRGNVRDREIVEAKLFEREQIARELHDTVAHHISAIVIQAQAGRTLAPNDPHASVAALETIEREASKTLSEMRAIVGVLRRGDAEVAPQQGFGDLERLARDNGGPLRIEVDIDGDVDAVGPGIQAAVFRIAQESITNVRRHARRASIVRVDVGVDEHEVRLTIADDGEPAHYEPGTTSGFGLVGMTERATIHGGTLHAGPQPERGWVVKAVLPKTGRKT